MEQLDLQPKASIDGMEIYPFFIGDPAYPLLPWLIKGYTGVRTEKEESFNAYLNKVVENAFGRLKGRWRFLQKRIDINVDFVPHIVATCYILHNILERRKAPYRKLWNENVRSSEGILVQPCSSTQSYNMQGEEIRGHLKNYIATNFDIIQSLRPQKQIFYCNNL